MDLYLFPSLGNNPAAARMSSTNSVIRCILEINCPSWFDTESAECEDMRQHSSMEWKCSCKRQRCFEMAHHQFFIAAYKQNDNTLFQFSK